MSEREWRKLDALEHSVNGDWTMAMGSQAAGLSERQFLRLRRAYESTGDKVQVVIHGNTGRRPTNCLKDSLVKEVLRLRKGKYAGFNDTHFTESWLRSMGSRSVVNRYSCFLGVPGHLI